MKNANGTGSVVFLGKNRRRPYAVKITVGYNEKGHPIPKFLTNENGEKYFAERLDAEELRIKYNRAKGNIDINKLEYTFSQVYEDFKFKYMPTKEEIKEEKETHIKAKGKLGASTASSLMCAYNKCKSLYDKPYVSLKKDDFLDIIKNTNGGASTMSGLTNLFRKLDSYALEQDIIVKGYADLIQLNDTYYNNNKRESVPFTYEEIAILWENEGNIVIDILLFLLYTGMRIEEALFTKTENINLEQWYLIGGLKTSNGKNRIVPIHSAIQNIIKRYYNKNNKFLFMIDNKRITYVDYTAAFHEKLSEIGISQHRTHDARKTLRSELDRVCRKDEKLCIDRIIGHRSGDTGLDTYTKKSIEELRETIEKVNYLAKKNVKVTYLKLCGS